MAALCLNGRFMSIGVYVDCVAIFTSHHKVHCRYVISKYQTRTEHE